MLSRRRSMAVVVGAFVVTASVAAASVAAYGDPEAEATAAALAREPAALLASAVLDAADAALASGDTAGALARLGVADRSATLNPAVIYRVARLAERADDEGTAARAYRRYLSVAPAGADADSVRARLYELVAGPLHHRAPGAMLASTDLTQVTSAGEVAPTAKAKARHHHAKKHAKVVKHRRHRAKR